MTKGLIKRGALVIMLYFIQLLNMCSKHIFAVPEDWNVDKIISLFKKDIEIKFLIMEVSHLLSAS